MDPGYYNNPFPYGSYLYRMAEYLHYKIIDPDVFVNQTVVPEEKLGDHLQGGYLYVNQLKSGMVVVQQTLDLRGVVSVEGLEEKLRPLGIKTTKHDMPPEMAQTRDLVMLPIYRQSEWRCFKFGGKTICYQLPSIRPPPSNE